MNAVLFDMDNTILDRTGSLRDFARWQARGMLRPEVDDADLFAERFIELDDNGAVWKDRVYASLLAEFSITGWTIDELVTSYLLCFCGFCKPLPGATDAVKAIKRSGYRTAIVTNGKYPFQARNFGALGLSAWFDAVVVSEAVSIRKPDERIFRAACERLGVHPSDVVFVGDNPVADIQGANGVGMYTIYVPGHFGETCQEADAVLRDYRGLPDMIQAAAEESREIQ